MDDADCCIESDAADGKLGSALILGNDGSCDSIGDGVNGDSDGVSGDSDGVSVDGVSDGVIGDGGGVNGDSDGVSVDAV